MDYINGVGNFLWSTSAAVGNLGYNTSQSVYSQIFGRPISDCNPVSETAGWLNSLWYGPNASCINNSNPRGGGDSYPQYDIRRKDILMMWNRVGSNFVRVGGLSGAIAVMMGAYGAHAFHPDKSEKNLKNVFDIANQIHLVHSVALLAIPMTHRPVVAGTLMSMGTLLFCGTCYYHALTGDKSIRWITPYGGFMLIIGWLSIAI